MAGITTAIRVQDMDAALHVYIDVLGFRPVRPVDSAHNSLERGDARLMLEALQGFYSPAYNAEIAERLGSRSAQALYIEAPDLDALYAAAQKAGLRIVDPLATRDWGQTEFTVEDPDGTWLTFYRIGPAQ
ncbi:MAG: VOC family protein [Dehalococcoidia bacterium]